MKHTLEIGELDGFAFRHRIAGAHGKSVNKALDIVVEPVSNIVYYEVSKDKEVKSTTNYLPEAIELYNDI